MKSGDLYQIQSLNCQERGEELVLNNDQVSVLLGFISVVEKEDGTRIR